MVLAAVMIMLIRLDFKPPGERILANVREIIQNAEIVGFLVMMMFAGTFWGYIETFLFWYLDDMGASRSDDNLFMLWQHKSQLIPVSKIGVASPISILETHLSKGTSDLKQKCTQLATQFWDTVFHPLSHGVIHFVHFHKVFRGNTPNKMHHSV